MKRILAHVGYWLLSAAGNAGTAEWNDMKAAHARSVEAYYSADRERWIAIGKLRGLHDSLKLVDGLLAGGNIKEAQAQLRVAMLGNPV